MTDVAQKIGMKLRETTRKQEEEKLLKVKQEDLGTIKPLMEKVTRAREVLVTQITELLNQLEYVDNKYGEKTTCVVVTEPQNLADALKHELQALGKIDVFKAPLFLRKRNVEKQQEFDEMYFNSEEYKEQARRDLEDLREKQKLQEQQKEKLRLEKARLETEKKIKEIEDKKLREAIEKQERAERAAKRAQEEAINLKVQREFAERRRAVNIA